MNESPLSALEIEALTFIYEPSAEAPRQPRRHLTTLLGAGKVLLALISVALAALAWVGGRTGGA
jgi:hypothetical protein